MYIFLFWGLLNLQMITDYSIQFLSHSLLFVFFLPLHYTAPPTHPFALFSSSRVSRLCFILLSCANLLRRWKKPNLLITSVVKQLNWSLVTSSVKFQNLFFASIQAEIWWLGGTYYSQVFLLFLWDSKSNAIKIYKVNAHSWPATLAYCEQVSIANRLISALSQLIMSSWLTSHTWNPQWGAGCDHFPMCMFLAWPKLYYKDLLLSIANVQYRCSQWVI